MKLVCSKSNLLNGVQIVSKAVSSKTTMSILECIMVDATKGIITLTANDMDLGIETTIEGDILEKGMIALDAKMFLEIVRNFDDGDITVETDNSCKTVITCGKSKFTIIGKSGEDFSFLPLVEKEDSVVISQFTLNEVSKILPGGAENDVVISFTAKHIVFEFDNTTVVSRLIEGEYFRIDQMLSSDYETKVKINKKDLLSCINRASSLVKEGEKKPIIMNITDGNMELRINSVHGSMNEDIDIEKQGKDLMIGFNPKFLIDALRVIDDEEIDLYMVNPKAPCFIKDVDENYIYLILPVNFTTVS